MCGRGASIRAPDRLLRATGVRRYVAPAARGAPGGGGGGGNNRNNGGRQRAGNAPQRGRQSAAVDDEEAEPSHSEDVTDIVPTSSETNADVDGTAVAGDGDAPFDLTVNDPYRPRTNITPTSYLPVIRRIKSSALKHHKTIIDAVATTATPMPDDTSKGDDEHKDDGDDDTEKGSTELVIQPMRWSLVASWIKAPTWRDAQKKSTYATMNARSETVATASTYRRLINRKRCVVLMDGYFEWKKTTLNNGKVDKQPYFFSPKERQPRLTDERLTDECENVMMMAALYDTWYEAEKDALHYSFTILTTASAPDLEFVHDRMPVLLNTHTALQWLDCHKYTFDDCRSLLKPDSSPLEWWPVDRAVGSIKTQSDCTKPIALDEKKVGALDKFFIQKINTKEDEKKLDDSNSIILPIASSSSLNKAVKDGSATLNADEGDAADNVIMSVQKHEPVSSKRAAELYDMKPTVSPAKRIKVEMPQQNDRNQRPLTAFFKRE